MMLSFPTNIAAFIPQNVLCVLFVIALVILSQVALTGFNVWAKKQKLEFSNDVAGIVFGGISLIYSLVLAFVIVAVWDDYKNLERTIEAEADKLKNVLAHTAALPDSIRVNVVQSIYNYCGQVVNNEWQMNGTKTAQGPNAMRNLRQQLLTTAAQDKMQENILGAMDTDLSALGDLRRERLNHSHSQIPYMVWFVLDAGSIMLVIFFFFLNVPSLKLKRFHLSFLVSCMAMCMFLVYTLDHPFNDKNGISNQLYQDIQTGLKSFNNTSPG